VCLEYPCNSEDGEEDGALERFNSTCKRSKRSCMLPKKKSDITKMAHFKVTKIQSPSLAYTNAIYCSRPDRARFNQFAVNGRIYAQVKGFTYWLEPDDVTPAGSLAFNSFQRLCGQIQENDSVVVDMMSRDALGPILGTLKVAVDVYPPNKTAPQVEIESVQVEELIRKNFENHVFTTKQYFPISLEVNGMKIVVKVTVMGCGGIALEGNGDAPQLMEHRGILSSQTEIDVVSGDSGSIRVHSDKPQSRNLFRPDFNFEDLGIGGLSKEFGDIFRRAFASRVFPAKIIKDLGTNHVRGMLLYGPPGTGKTLIARQIAKFLRAREPKIVNGPEILDKYVGSSEAKIRELFADAEKEYKKEGENSQLHIIILDELDAICKSRGSSRDGTGVHDSIVNQLLSKIDGVDSLNNILLIGMTNRLDMIDEALLRPGRMEVHVEISLADEKGRVEIFNIHTKKMRDSARLSPDVSIPELAKRSKNFSGAEIEGLVRAAQSHAFNRHVNLNNVSAGVSAKDLESMRITMADFELAFDDIKPAFGQNEEDLEKVIRHGIVEFSDKVKHNQMMINKVVSRLVGSQGETNSVSDIASILLCGVDGTGKSALACDTARRFGFPFIRVISSDNFVGMSENSKVNAIAKTFDDAYKTKMSCIILDGLERLCEFVPIGPRFSNTILQALMVLIKRPHPKPGSKLQIIATCHETFHPFLEEVGGADSFTAVVKLPMVENATQAAELIAHAGKSARVTGYELQEVLSSFISPLPVKQVLMFAESARLGSPRGHQVAL
jgi:vesicle-fusing ATPase